MMTELRRLANEAAQGAFSEACVSYIKGKGWDERLLARWRAAENLLDAIDAYERTLQESDPEAPDYFQLMLAGGFVPESELRALYGDR